MDKDKPTNNVCSPSSCSCKLVGYLHEHDTDGKIIPLCKFCSEERCQQIGEMTDENKTDRIKD